MCWLIENPIYVLQVPIKKNKRHIKPDSKKYTTIFICQDTV